MTMNYNKYAAEIFAWNTEVGWWDDMNRCFFQTVQLIVTEVAEATEGDRKNLKDDHLPHRVMEEVELADALIRTLDLGGRYGLTYYPLVDPHRWVIDATSSNAKQHLAIVSTAVAFANMWEMGPPEVEGTDPEQEAIRVKKLSVAYSCLIKTIEVLATIRKYNLEQALVEKFAYNKTRIDHTRQHRGEHFDGKKY